MIIEDVTQATQQQYSRSCCSSFLCHLSPYQSISTTTETAGGPIQGDICRLLGQNAIRLIFTNLTIRQSNENQRSRQVHHFNCGKIVLSVCPRKQTVSIQMTQFSKVIGSLTHTIRTAPENTSSSGVTGQSGHKLKLQRWSVERKNDHKRTSNRRNSSASSSRPEQRPQNAQEEKINIGAVTECARRGVERDH